MKDRLNLPWYRKLELGLIALATAYAGAGGPVQSNGEQQFPPCDQNSVGMTKKDTGVTLECHLNGRWERVVPDPRLAHIIDLPPDVNRDSLKFSGWIGDPQWDPEEKRWVRQARVVGTEGFGVVGVEVKIPHR